MWEYANRKSTEYAGRQHAGQNQKKDIRSLIPTIPYNVSPTKNAQIEEILSAEKHTQEQLLADTFFNMNKIKVSRLLKKQEKKE